MNSEDEYAALTERMREIERQLDVLDRQYVDGYAQTYHIHTEIRKTAVTKEQLAAIQAILDGN